jgi:hypothetical protein
MRIHIAIGITPDGDYTSLYLGDDAEGAVSAIQEAGKKKNIVQGLHLSNPQSLPHKRYHFPENAGKAQAVEAYSHTVEPKPAKKKVARKADEPEAPAKPAAAPEDTSDDDPFATKKAAK